MKKDIEQIYRETFSQLHTSVQIGQEDYRIMKKRTNYVRLFAAAAVAAALLCAMTATALALNVFGLRDLLIPQKMHVYVPEPPVEEGAPPPSPDPEQFHEADMVGLSGYPDTPEAKATAEWLSFLDGYDRDEAIISQIGNDPTPFDGDYGAYQVYTQEMADTLEEIAARYGLTILRESAEIVEGRETLVELTGPFMAYEWGSAYLYEDGTFGIDAWGDLEGYGNIDFQVHNAAKGTMHEVALNIWDISRFTDWTYTCADGVTVELALGPDRSMVWVDLPDSFFFVNVLTGYEGDSLFSSGPIDQRQLEAFADGLTLSQLHTPAR